MKRVGVLGSLIWDRIWPPATAAATPGPREAWGGIAYSLASMAATLAAGWQIVPLIKVGRDLEAESARLLASIPKLEPGAGIVPVPEPTNRVELRYHDAARRCERLTGGVPPWQWDELAPRVAGLDALFINFISGFELELAEMERFRAGFRGPIYADLHSLMLARDADGRRSLRPLADRDRWLRCFDALQLNDDELAALAGGGEDGHEFARRTVRAAPGLVLVTRGERGADYSKSGDFPAEPAAWPSYRARAPAGRAAPVQRRVPLLRRADGDPTGCGDVWGGACFAALLAGNPVEAAMRVAHEAAARKLAFSGAAGLYAHLRRG